MPLQQFPDELLLHVGQYLSNEPDFYSLCRVSRRFYPIYNELLYRHNLRHGEGTALLWAVTRGRARTVEICFAMDAEESTKYIKSHGAKLIFWASSKGYKEFIHYLISRGADIDSLIPSHQGSSMQSNETMLMRALASPKTELAAQTLAACGADIHFPWPDRTTILQRASYFAFDVLVKHCLLKGASVNAANDMGYTALHFAVMVSEAKKHTLETVQYLLEFGANPAKVDGQGHLPIDIWRDRLSPPERVRRGYQASLQHVNFSLGNSTHIEDAELSWDRLSSLQKERAFLQEDRRITALLAASLAEAKSIEESSVKLAPVYERKMRARSACTSTSQKTLDMQKQWTEMKKESELKGSSPSNRRLAKQKSCHHTEVMLLRPRAGKFYCQLCETACGKGAALCVQCEITFCAFCKKKQLGK